MCKVHPTSLRMLAVFLGYLIAQAKAYPMQGWYPQSPREYQDDEYYYAPKIQYYYDAPAMRIPEVYGQVPYPYFYDPYGHFVDNEGAERQEERLAALPIGQETWFENEASPRWRSNDVDDVNAAFLDNLILTQMAQDAQRRRENARAAFPAIDYEEKDTEDEDERELKALAGKPLYHVPKTVPKIEDDDYASDDGFINWNGYKRSLATAAPVPTTIKPRAGQKEEVMLRPAQSTKHQDHLHLQNNRDSNFYNTVAHLLKNKSKSSIAHESTKQRRIDKRFVAGDSDLVLELRGLKHRIAT